MSDKAEEHWGWLLERCWIADLTIPLLLVTAERVGIGRRQLQSWRPCVVEPCKV